MNFLKKMSIITIIIAIAISTKVLAFGPSSMPTYSGIDVSEWQGEINYSSVANDGIEVV